MKQDTFGRRILANSGLGILFKILSLILSLASRYAFVFFLSEEHLGIQGLYSNMLTMLSMADFGINAVMIFMLYEPLATQDIGRLSALVKLFKRLYLAIAAAVLAIGMLTIPLLPYIVSESMLSTEELIKYYLFFVLNSAISYLGSYKSVLLMADQKGYIVNAIVFLSNAARIVAQITVLYLTRNFTAYLLMMLLSTVLNNIILTWSANHHYPHLNQVKQSADISDVKPKLIEKTKAVFLYRIGGTLIDSTDNILISILVGTVTVGYYSNYSMITMNVFSLIGVLSQAYMTGIGNRSVGADISEKKKAFYDMILVYFILGTMMLCGILCVMNDFVFLWLKQEQYILSQGFVAILAVRLFLDIILSPNWVFRESQGLFNEARIIRLWAAALNLFLSILLGKFFGLTGIIGATAVSKVMTTVWYEPNIICKKVFQETTGAYWRLWTKLAIATAVSVIVCEATSSVWNVCIHNTNLRLLINGATCCLIVIAVYAVFIFQEKQYVHVAKSIKAKIKLLTKK